MSGEGCTTTSLVVITACHVPNVEQNTYQNTNLPGIPGYLQGWDDQQRLLLGHLIYRLLPQMEECIIHDPQTEEVL